MRFSNHCSTGLFVVFLAIICIACNTGTIGNNESADSDTKTSDFSDTATTYSTDPTLERVTCDVFVAFVTGCGFDTPTVSNIEKECTELSYTAIPEFQERFLGCMMGLGCDIYWAVATDAEDEREASRDIEDCIFLSVSQTVLDDKRAAVVARHCEYKEQCGSGDNTQTCIDTFSPINDDLLFLLMTDPYVDSAFDCYAPLPSCLDTPPIQCVGNVDDGLIDALEDLFASF
jgi:hypothetical protein